MFTEKEEGGVNVLPSITASGHGSCLQSKACVYMYVSAALIFINLNTSYWRQTKIHHTIQIVDETEDGVVPLNLFIVQKQVLYLRYNVSYLN